MNNEYNIIENKSKIYFNGSKWKSNRCGDFIIIGKTSRNHKNKSYIYFLCQFEDGTIIERDMTNIKLGNVKNPNYLSVCSIGYIGQGKWISKLECGKSTREYTTWLHMMVRCYSHKCKIQNPSYNDVIVCERWHNFQNFCDDIKHLPGYNEWKRGDRYELDKDIICENLKLNLQNIFS